MGLMDRMMESMMGRMSQEKKEAMMHEMMPKMMDSCFSHMTTEQRQGMLGMCRDMLDQVEKKYLPQEGQEK